MIRKVKTENGWVRGIEAADPRITAFKGIPFAAPPVGENRWRAPQPCADWEGVRDAFRFGPAAVQDTPGLGDDVYCREWHVDPQVDMDEDCLYLNVWTGAKDPNEKQPVLVWFYGGGLQWGYPAEMEFDGERLARRGIVVVTVNYRINVFGFLAHPQLTDRQPDAPTNFGSLDQQAGLKWVIRNIRAFGGDPDQITIAGQSAGGGSVLSQMACPANKGLFQRAVIMSGMIGSPYTRQTIGIPKPLWEAEENGVEFLDFLGVKDIDEARKLDAFYLRDKYGEYAKDHPRMFSVLDKKFCVGDPLAMLLNGHSADVPVMAGNTVDEFLQDLSASSKEEAKEKAKGIFGKDAEEYLSFQEVWEEADQGIFGKVSGLECTIKGVLDGRRKNGSTQNGYYYKFGPEIPGWDHAGCFHSVDLWFFFETLAKCWRPFTGKHYDLARQMCNYWANFIKTGDPNGADADGQPMPHWEPYTDEKPAEMVFTTEGAKSVCGQESNYIRFLSKKIMDSQEEIPCLDKWNVSFWEGNEVRRETFAMIEEAGSCEAPFLREPEEIIKVESYSGELVYEQGRDYLVKDGKLVLPEGSRIPHTGWEQWIRRTKEEAQEEAKREGVDPGFEPVATTDGSYLSLCSIGHPEFVTKWQTAVTYRAKESWEGSVPQGALKQLPGLSEKIKKQESVKILLYGDSISCGWDCSGKYEQNPWQPVWYTLLLDRMEKKWGIPVCFHNTSVSGMDTEWAIANAKERVCVYQPDLVILGYGMNDRCDGAQYAEKTMRLIGTIREDCPQTEFVLIATTLPNPLTATPPMYFSSHQAEYSQSLKTLCQEGIVLADVQAVQKEVQEKKRYIDLTGNLLNHPNDWLAGIQAQVVAATLEV